MIGRAAKGGAALACFLFAAVSCQQILGIPNPDDAKELDDIGKRLCSCPTLGLQGAEVVAECTQGVEAADDTVLRSLADADCSDCDNVAECYQLATGAEENPSASCNPIDGCGVCTTHAGCGSFSCCFQGFAAFGETGAVVGTCCDSCLGCAELFSADIATDSALCVESFAPTYGLIACVCDPAHVEACRGQGRCADIGPVDPADDTYSFCQLGNPDCVVCMYQEANGACADLENACLNDHGRPIAPGGG